MLTQQDSERDEEAAVSKGESTNSEDQSIRFLGESPQPKASSSRFSSLFPRSIFSRQACLNLLYICFLQTHSKLFDEFLPTYMQAASPETKSETQLSGLSSLFIFGGGLNMSSRTTAIYLTIYGISAMVIQLLIFPPTARWLGPLKALRIASSLYPLVYFLTPYLSKLSHLPTLRGICSLLLLLSKAFCGIFAFPCSKIMLCNSARAKNTLGSLNGISASSQQLVRALVAILVGKLFSMGLERGVIVLPWWGLGVISLGGLLVVFWIEDEEDKQ
jgi:hypothetical protein